MHSLETERVENIDLSCKGPYMRASSESSLWSSFGYVKGENLVHMYWSDKICVWTQFCFVVSND